MEFVKPKEYYSYLFFLYFPLLMAGFVFLLMNYTEFGNFTEVDLLTKLFIIIFLGVIVVIVFAGLYEFNQFYYEYYVGEDYIVIKKLLRTYQINAREIDSVTYKKFRIYSRGNVRKYLSQPGMRIKIKYCGNKTISLSIRMISPEKKTIYKFLKNGRFRHKNKLN